MELDPTGNPIILHGKSGSNGGLYCTRWNGTGFDAPIQVTTETGLFINDSEGPRMAVSGNKVAVGYQISGQWATGGRVVLSEDGGQTWGDPIPVSPGATEDHFMPVPAFDADDNPWVVLKWGNAPALEGVLHWDAATGGFAPAVDAGAAIPGDAVCECCASMPFMLDGRQYNLVRNNLSGHSRRPVFRTAGGVVHLVYQRSTGNEIHYRRGTIGTSGLDAWPTVEWTCAPTGDGWRIDGLTGVCQWRLLDWSGRTMASGRSQNGTIETGRWNAGLLEIQTENARKTFKVNR